MTGPDRGLGSADVAAGTGDAVVDAALARLEAAADGTVDDQLAAGEAAHEVLRGKLADIDGG